MPCARVLQEAREVLGLVNPWEVKKSANADPYECLTYDNVGQLAYLHAFVSEVGEQLRAQMARAHRRSMRWYTHENSSACRPFQASHCTFRLLNVTICTSQVLRLHPTAPKTVRFAAKADVLPDGTPIKPGDTSARVVDLPVCEVCARACTCVRSSYV